MTTSPLHAAVSDLLEVDDVARRLSLSPEFVRRLLRAGKLAGIRFGKLWRVDPRDLQSFIDRQRAPGPVVERRRAPREASV